MMIKEFSTKALRQRKDMREIEIHNGMLESRSSRLNITFLLRLNSNTIACQQGWYYSVKKTIFFNSYIHIRFLGKPTISHLLQAIQGSSSRKHSIDHQNKTHQLIFRDDHHANGASKRKVVFQLIGENRRIGRFLYKDLIKYQLGTAILPCLYHAASFQRFPDPLRNSFLLYPLYFHFKTL